MTQKLPLPITVAMLTRANENEAKPRYQGAGALSDWHGGSYGNEQDVAEAWTPVANSHSANITADYEPQHQKQKGNNMVPARVIAGDIGKDYGAYTGLAGRTGTIQPRQPYPTAALE